MAVGDEGGRPQGVSLRGNLKGKNSNALVGKGGANNPVDFCGWVTFRRTYLDDNGTPLEGEGGVLGYWGLWKWHGRYARWF